MFPPYFHALARNYPDNPVFVVLGLGQDDVFDQHESRAKKSSPATVDREESKPGRLSSMRRGQLSDKFGVTKPGFKQGPAFQRKNPKSQYQKHLRPQ